jgi:hypothetical protein
MARQPNYNLARMCSVVHAVGKCVVAIQCLCFLRNLISTGHLLIPLKVTLIFTTRELESMVCIFLMTVMVCRQRCDLYFCFSQGGKSGAVQKCSACRGRGVRIMIRQLAPGMVQQMQSVCSDCNGEGKAPDWNVLGI